MMHALRNLVGQTQVREMNDQIEISNIPVFRFLKAVYTIWGTGKIEANMFTKVTSSKVVFNKFFAPDIAYALKTIKYERKGFRHLERVLELLYTETWLRETLVEHPSMLNYARLGDMVLKLLPHQREFLEHYDALVPRYKLKGYLLGAAPGSGKTIANIGLFNALECGVMICLVPKNSVDKVWVDTIATIYREPQTYWASTQGTPPKPGMRHYVFHYERLGEALEFFRSNRFSNPYIVLDESHNFNELSAQRTHDFIELCQLTGAKHIIWASGTPVKAIGNEVIPLLQTLASDFNTDAQTRFKAIFGKSAKRAVDILSNRLGMMTFKVDKSKIVQNDVQTFEQRVRIPNGGEYTLENIRGLMKNFILERTAFYTKHRKDFERQYQEGLDTYTSGPYDRAQFAKYQAYIKVIRTGYDPETMREQVIFCNQYEKTIMMTLSPIQREEFRNARSVVKYVGLKIQGEALGRILGKQRSQCHVDMVPHCQLEDIVEGALKKTVIFTSYVEVVKETDRYLREKGFTPTLIYGDTNKDLAAIVTKFGKEIDANPMIATFQSLSTAVPLVMANTVVMLNSPFRIHEYDQAMSRVDRLGQDSPVKIYNMFLDTGALPNISTRSEDILLWSKQQVEAILGTKVSNSLDLVLEEFKLPDYEISLEDLTLVESVKPAWTNW